jgi:hypothetical protein
MISDETVSELTDALASAGRNIAGAITAAGAPGTDASGGTILSLTEAVMGVTAGLCEVAASINRLADAVRDSRS